MAFCFLTGTFAQRFIVTGTVESGKTNRGVEFVTAALLKSDSTGVTSAMTNEKGTFRLRAKSAGSYIVKISYVGFKTEYRNVVLTRQTDSINIGRIPLENSDNLLKEAVVSVTAARVEQQGDTTVFNASAYRVPEGSTLEALEMCIRDRDNATGNFVKVEQRVPVRIRLKASKDLEMLRAGLNVETSVAY